MSRKVAEWIVEGYAILYFASFMSCALLVLDAYGKISKHGLVDAAPWFGLMMPLYGMKIGGPWVTMLFGLGSLTLTLGLWNKNAWARQGALLFAVLILMNLAGELLTSAQDSLLHPILQLILTSAAIYFFDFNRHVKALFVHHRGP